jgi:hypothetical protein
MNYLLLKRNLGLVFLVQFYQLTQMISLSVITLGGFYCNCKARKQYESKSSQHKQTKRRLFRYFIIHLRKSKDKKVL